jgi:hypothetical protein
LTSHFYWLTLGILSVWRCTHLLYAEDGPWNIFVRLRQFVGDGFWASLLDCFYCLSLWIAAPFGYFLGQTWKERTLLWMALSGGAIIIERVTQGTSSNPPVVYREDEEKENVLRQEQSPNKSGDSGLPLPSEHSQQRQ